MNDNFNRTIFYRRPSVWDRLRNRNIASAICIAISLTGFGIYHHFDTVRAYESGIKVGEQKCR